MESCFDDKTDFEHCQQRRWVMDQMGKSLLPEKGEHLVMLDECQEYLVPKEDFEN